MKRVADYIVDFLCQSGVKDVFMVSGGGMMFLSDGLAKSGKLNVICNHHEQAAAMAAATYAKYNLNLGVVYTTTGCGSTNAITGVLGAWQDSVPLLIISGQCKRKETIINSKLKLRQLGVQEADIISIVESITKYSVMVNDPGKIAFHLEKAVYLAKSGRPGPVWIDVPLDVQAAMIEEDGLEHYSTPLEQGNCLPEKTCDELKRLCMNSRRPIIIAGQGIRLADCGKDFKQFVHDKKIPVAASRLGINNLPTEDPVFIGLIGNKGQRAANFAVQNADLIIALGSRLSVSSTGHEYHNFARNAKLIVVDIDQEEHKKNTVKIDLFINSDVKFFLQQIREMDIFGQTDSWLETCNRWKKKFQFDSTSGNNAQDKVDLYDFVRKLSLHLKPDSVVVTDSGSTSYVVPQAISLNDGQLYLTSSAQGAMGYTIPAVIGASVAKQKKEVIGIVGDGSFQMNIQELQTIVHYGLPVKIFVWNNEGYLSIRGTQNKFFEGRLIGADNSSGVSFPELEKIAGAYGIKFCRIDKTGDLDEVITQVLASPDAMICEVMCLPDQKIAPTVSSFTKADGTIVSKPLEDMHPFMSREEFLNEMIVPPLEEESE